MAHIPLPILEPGGNAEYFVTGLRKKTGKLAKSKSQLISKRRSVINCIGYYGGPFFYARNGEINETGRNQENKKKNRYNSE